MTTTFIATGQADHFTEFHFSQSFSLANGTEDFQFASPVEPYNGFFEQFNSSPQATSLATSLISQITSIANSLNVDTFALFAFELFDDTLVDYSLSTSPVFIDLEQSVQSGGFAQGDILTDVFEITGSAFDDVIRGSNPSDYPADTVPIVVNGRVVQESLNFTLNNPGNNVLNGGNGNDVLEGRGGADTLNGGSGFDFASYESSPAAVTVRLPGVGSDTQTAIATGSDASGDTFSSIEGLIGSKLDDHLTGNSQNNVLAGGLGNDVLDGKNGNDTADYSRDHFFDIGDTADKVVVHLGLNGANGSGVEFDAIVDVHTLTVSFNQVSTDTLVSIENVTGTSGPDEIVGNEQANMLDGRQSNDLIDGGFGNDTLIGGSGIDTVSYASHNSVSGEYGFIALGTNGLGVAQYFTNGSNQLVETDSVQGFENVTGSSLAETIVGNASDNILDGGFGDDRLVGDNGSDTASYISHDGGFTLLGEGDTISLGLNGANGTYVRSGYVSTLGRFHFQTVETDTLVSIENVTGSNHSETINGNEQNNVLEGRGGNDVINGGAGDDTYDFRGSSLGDDRYFDSGGSDKILVDSLSTFYMSKSGSDLFIKLQSGTITISNHFGGNPIETITDSSGKSLVLATGLIGADKAGVIAGDDSSEFMDGGGGDDYLFGNGGKDHMLGSAGNDNLDGGKGNDKLDGGSGDDILAGGKGSDTFIFEPVASDGLPGGNDIITDFVHGQDNIDLSAFHIELSDLFGSHQSSEDPITIQTIGNDTVLSFEGGSITIQNVTELHHNDFIV